MKVYLGTILLFLILQFGILVFADTNDNNLELSTTNSDIDSLNVTADGNSTDNNVNGTKKISEGTIFKSIFNAGFGALTDHAHEVKFIQDLQANGTDPEEFFKNITRDTANMTELERQQYITHNHYYGNRGYGYGGYHSPSLMPFFLGGLMGYGLGRSRGFGGGYGGGYGGFGGGGYRTSLAMAALPNVARQVTRSNGYSFNPNTYNNYGAGGYGNRGGYGTNMNNRGGTGTNYGWTNPGHAGTGGVGGKPPAYDSLYPKQGAPPSYDSMYPKQNVGAKPPPAGWNVGHAPAPPPRYVTPAPPRSKGSNKGWGGGWGRKSGGIGRVGGRGRG